MTEHTANDRLLDQSVRHQIGLLRLSAAIADDINRNLDQLEAMVKERLRRAEGRRTKKRLDKLLIAIRDMTREAHVAMGKEARVQLRDLAKEEAEFLGKRLSGAIPAELGIDIVRPDADTLNALVTNDPFRGKFMREWTSELSDATFRDARDAVRLGVLGGESNEQIARRLEQTMQVARHRARTFARTATNHVSNAAREQVLQRNKRVMRGVQWVSTLDTKTSPICQARDGRVYEVGEGPRPPAHPNCRSTAVPVLKSWRELGFKANQVSGKTRSSMDGRVPRQMNYNDWLRSQVQNGRMDVVEDALGKKRAKLFAAGGLRVDRFVDPTGRKLTLAQLKQRNRDLFKRLGVEAP